MFIFVIYFGKLLNGKLFGHILLFVLCLYDQRKINTAYICADRSLLNIALFIIHSSKLSSQIEMAIIMFNSANNLYRNFG